MRGDPYPMGSLVGELQTGGSARTYEPEVPVSHMRVALPAREEPGAVRGHKGETLAETAGRRPSALAFDGRRRRHSFRVLARRRRQATAANPRGAAGCSSFVA